MMSFNVKGHGEDEEGFFVVVPGRADPSLEGSEILLDGSTRARVRAVRFPPGKTARTLLYLYPPEEEET